MSLHLVEGSASADGGFFPITLVLTAELAHWLERLPASDRTYAERMGFKAEVGERLVLPNGGVAVGVAATDDIWALGDLANSLPPGGYYLGQTVGDPTSLALGWALGSYVFSRYRKPRRAAADLIWPAGADRAQVTALAEAIFMARDLINTPAGDLGPAELADAASALADRFGADLSVINGDALLDAGYPAVHAVGRASAKRPCLIDLNWGDEAAPKVTLVGKGVCFDSGGLDIKSSAGMLMMKKDMGGAAIVLALGQMIMELKLPVRLRILVPAVENMISGNAFRPLDVLPTRHGVTVEVGNTDAEGRLILCDALAEADRGNPDLLIDCATLTGAARVALGPELPALFTRHDDLAEALTRHGQAVSDPLWRLPLWGGYRRLLDSKTADLSSTGESPYGGAITAALFLAEFVRPETRWLHIDAMAWNVRSRPGRPEGGEAQAVRALFELVKATAQA